MLCVCVKILCGLCKVCVWGLWCVCSVSLVCMWYVCIVGVCLGVGKHYECVCVV